MHEVWSNALKSINNLLKDRYNTYFNSIIKTFFYSLPISNPLKGITVFFFYIYKGEILFLILLNFEFILYKPHHDMYIFSKYFSPKFCYLPPIHY